MAVLSGQARPKAIAVAFVIGAWIICVPFAYPLSNWIHPGLEGLWVALLAGYSVTAALAIVSVYRSDWEALALAAVKRSEGATVLQSESLPLLEADAMKDGCEHDVVSVALDTGSVNNH